MGWALHRSKALTEAYTILRYENVIKAQNPHKLSYNEKSIRSSFIR
jgi:hypothetical protein